MDGRLIEGDESMDRGDGNDDQNYPAVDAAAAAHDNSDREDSNAEANLGNDERAARRMRLNRADPHHPVGANRSQRAARNENDNVPAVSRNNNGAGAEPNVIQLIERIRDFLSEEEGAIDEELASFALEASGKYFAHPSYRTHEPLRRSLMQFLLSRRSRGCCELVLRRLLRTAFPTKCKTSSLASSAK